MSDPKERSVRFILEESFKESSEDRADADLPIEGPGKLGGPEKPFDNELQLRRMDVTEVTTRSHSEASASVKKTSSLFHSNRIGEIQPRPKYVLCHECGKNIPINEWPDHRDRLREVKLAEQMSTFHRTLIQLVCEFLMWILKNVYFREVTIVGEDNVPPVGAVVFYGNHQNQFIDALMMNSNCGRNVRFLMAEKSFHKPVIGFFGRMFGSVPVIRPQDVPLIPGEGNLVHMEEVMVTGEDTCFKNSLNNGDIIKWVAASGVQCTAQVQRIHSDTQIEVTVPIQVEHAILNPTSFQISRRIDHSHMYAQVYDTLHKNHCIGIFPEGGSHDHTSLLPLKAGVALFSLGAAERNISVKIVPCGLTYFYGHKFRSRAYLEFGEPITPPEELVTMFMTDKRKATGIFLQQLNDALRAVTINVPDWNTLKFLHSFRQLYQPINCTLSARDYLRLTRRLGTLIEQEKGNPEFIDFRIKVDNYNNFCSALWVRDSQIVTLKHLMTSESYEPLIRLLLRRAFTLFLMAVILVPFFFVGLPIGCFIEYYSTKAAKKALSESNVKIVGADVKGSFKVLTGFFVVPFTVGLITLITFLFTDGRIALVVLFSLPMALYVSLLILQEAILELRAGLPLFMSLISRHKQFKKLYEMREALATIAKSIVQKYDVQLAKEMEEYTMSYAECIDDLEREPSLFSLRYNVRRRQATNS